jgi:hypothetical protein
VPDAEGFEIRVVDEEPAERADVERIRPQIDEAKAATDRFRAKAMELIAGLRDREAEVRDQAARRRAEQEVQEKVERAREEALAGGAAEEPEGSPEESGGGTVQPLAPKAAAAEPARTRYVGGRRLRTF